MLGPKGVRVADWKAPVRALWRSSRCHGARFQHFVKFGFCLARPGPCHFSSAMPGDTGQGLSDIGQGHRT